MPALESSESTSFRCQGRDRFEGRGGARPSLLQ